MHNTTTLPNFHVLIIKYVGQTNCLPSRVKIISERFKQSVTLSYGDEGNTLEQAEEWLIRNGHNVIGHGEGKGHSYVICGHINNRFKSIK